MRMTIADLMCETPVTIGPASSMDAALDAFYEYEATELYVVDKSGTLLGILPDYELLKAELNGEARTARVDQLMSRSIPVVTPESDAAEVVRRFRDSHCSRIPVVKAGRLIGIVTRADVIRLMAVFRRIESEKKSSKVGPKAPKALQSFLSPSTRGRQAKASSSTKPVSERRSKPARRASATRSSR